LVPKGGTFVAALLKQHEICIRLFKSAEELLGSCCVVHVEGEYAQPCTLRLWFFICVYLEPHQRNDDQPERECLSGQKPSAPARKQHCYDERKRHRKQGSRKIQ